MKLYSFLMEEEKLKNLENMAKCRRKATGEKVSVSGLIREAVDNFLNEKLKIQEFLDRK